MNNKRNHTNQPKRARVEKSKRPSSTKRIKNKDFNGIVDEEKKEVDFPRTNPKITKRVQNIRSSVFHPEECEFEGIMGGTKEFDDNKIDALDIFEFCDSSDSNAAEGDHSMYRPQEATREGKRIGRVPVWTKTNKKITEQELIDLVENEGLLEKKKSWEEGRKSTNFGLNDPRFHCTDGINPFLKACENRLIAGKPFTGSIEAEKLVNYLNSKKRLNLEDYQESNRAYIHDSRKYGGTGSSDYTICKKNGIIPTQDFLERHKREVKRAREIQQKRVGELVRKTPNFDDFSLSNNPINNSTNANYNEATTNLVTTHQNSLEWGEISNGFY